MPIGQTTKKIKKRTTIYITEKLLYDFKKNCIKQGESISSVIEKMVQEYLKS
jgi:hypothetical protein